MTSTAPQPGVMIAARLPDGRLLIARIDPTTRECHSPLQRALRAADIPLDTRQSPWSTGD